MFMQTFILSSESTQLSRLITSLFITCETKSYVAIVNGQSQLLFCVLFFLYYAIFMLFYILSESLKKRCSMHS